MLFVDLDELVEEGIIKAGEIDVLIPTNELLFIKENLMEAELARRRGMYASASSLPEEFVACLCLLV